MRRNKKVARKRVAVNSPQRADPPSGQCAPPRLFKYLHPDRIDVLRNRRIRFTSALALNDPFELRPHVAGFAPENELQRLVVEELPKMAAQDYSKLDERVRRAIPFSKFESMVHARLQDEKKNISSLIGSLSSVAQRSMTEVFTQQIGVLCLTEAPDSLLMWAHYADSHRGFLIEFDPKSAFLNQRRSATDEMGYLRKVLYSEARPSVMLFEIEDFSPFLTKGLEWGYEREWRMMRPVADATRVIGDGPHAVHLFQFPPDAIKSVIFGCRIDESTKDAIRELIARRSEFSHVSLFEAQVDARHYKVNVVSLDD